MSCTDLGDRYGYRLFLRSKGRCKLSGCHNGLRLADGKLDPLSAHVRKRNKVIFAIFAHRKFDSTPVVAV